MKHEYRVPQVRPVSDDAPEVRARRVSAADRRPGAGGTTLLAEMADLSERLELAAQSSDRRLAAALACAGASVWAARARLGCDMLLVDDAAVGPHMQVAEVGGLHIDRASRTVTRDGELLRLSRTMFDMVSLLATEPTRVFSKAEMFRTIWHSEHLPKSASRTVDSHIVRLRNALGGPPWVHTHWGVGVSLLPPNISRAGGAALTAA